MATLELCKFIATPTHRHRVRRTIQVQHPPQPGWTLSGLTANPATGLTVDKMHYDHSTETYYAILKPATIDAPDHQAHDNIDASYGPQWTHDKITTDFDTLRNQAAHAKANH